MLEDLKRLKEEIEKNNKNKEYAIIEGFPYLWEKPNQPLEIKTMDQIIEEENTDEFIKQFEQMMKEWVVFLSENGFPYDQISLISFCGLFVEPRFAEIFKQEYSKPAGKTNDELLDSTFNDLSSHISHKYGYLRCELDTIRTGLEEISYEDFTSSFCRKDEEFYKKCKEIESKSISGIIDIEKFIKKMHKLGYSIIYTVDDNELQTSADYIKAATSDIESQISLSASFGRIKKEDTSFKTI